MLAQSEREREREREGKKPCIPKRRLHNLKKLTARNKHTYGIVQTLHHREASEL